MEISKMQNLFSKGLLAGLVVAALPVAEAVARGNKNDQPNMTTTQQEADSRKEYRGSPAAGTSADDSATTSDKTRSGSNQNTRDDADTARKNSGKYIREINRDRSDDEASGGPAGRPASH
jgi:hypothetical protein